MEENAKRPNICSTPIIHNLTVEELFDCKPLSKASRTSSMWSVKPDTLYRPSDFKPERSRSNTYLLELPRQWTWRTCIFKKKNSIYI